ncbi:sigma-70 family RNA polymerase sigma factor [Brevibacillus daliensis]|uniref:sigma-70 family RNA polymerase sigma factor n=1 Tax=Brevibacillus daliensis TaxID=2892995 RepID=UPI001E30BCB1|nr:sigma-70 family RNA polymerase sigma factor [Brevibacillus daliensis]
MYSEIKQENPAIHMTKEAALEVMMREYGDKIIQLVYLIVKDRNMAEDITQEVFLKAYRGIDSFRGDSNLKTWLYRIAINESKQYLRSWSFRRIFSTFKKEETPSDSSELYVEKKVIDKMTKEAIAEKVMAMSPQYRQVILLYYYEDLSTKEIAEILEVSGQVVRTKLHRARKQFKLLVEKEGLEWM